MRRLSRWLLALPVRTPRPATVRRAARMKLGLEPMEPRLVPDGRPLPLPFIFAGAGSGDPPGVRSYRADTGALQYEAQPFEAGFSGGVRVAAGDVDHDGIPDLIAAAGPGGGPRVRVLDGQTGAPIAGALGSFFAYDPAFTGGVYVAAGDVDGDGWADVVTAAGEGGGPHVEVFSGRTGGLLASFFAFDPDFRGGATIAAADLTGDGKAELIVGAGPGGSPEVRVFDALTGALLAGPRGDFLAFDASFAGGVDVGSDAKAGDVTGDGVPDIVVGSGPGMAAEVKVFDGLTGAAVGDFQPFGAGMTAGVRVATAYVDDDAKADIVVGTGAGVAGTVKAFSGQTFAELAAPMSPYTPFGGGFTGGVYVAASNDPPTGSGGSGGGGGDTRPLVDLGGGPDAFEEDEEPGWFTVTRYSGTGTLTVTYTVSKTSTATPGADYDALSGSVSFAAGQTKAYIYVDPIDDDDDEGTETVTVRLDDSTAYTSDVNGGTVNIIDNDASGGSGGTPLLPNPLATPPQTCPPGAGPKPAVTAPQQPATSANPVRYFDGVVILGATDLGSDGLGLWGQTRTWSNDPAYAGAPVTGYGWADGFRPQLRQTAGGLVLTTDASTAYFYDGVGSPDGAGNYATYTPRFSDPSGVKYDSGADTFKLADADGGALTFAGFGTARPVHERGALVSRADAAGQTAAVVAWDAQGRPTEVQQSATAGGVTVTESYLTAYAGPGLAYTGQVASVTLRRKVGAGAWATVRSVDYEYYSAFESGGPPRNLERATVRDAAGAVVDQTYYRYYTADAFAGGVQVGYVGGLKYALGAEAYGRLKAAAGGTDADVDAAADATVAPYADNYFEYDADRRATKEVASGAGCSACSAGQGAYTYTYTASGNTTGFNNWAVKTVETLPDGTTNTVYTNGYGEVMLTAHAEGGQQWLTYSQYDGSGRVVLQADPSAVTGFNDAYADLMHVVSSNAAYLSDGSGLVTTYAYGASTTATGTTAGDVAGYLSSSAVRQGETGADVPQEAWTYFRKTGGAVTTTPVASDTVYRNDDGTGAQTTSSAYTYVSGTAQVASVTTTLPTVTTAENGPNTATSTTTVYDSYERPVWTKDAGGFLTYTAYDALTGAVVKTIDDVNTANTSDFSNLPSGWTTPSGGGLHLITTYEVDDQGRVTKETSPAGRVDYTVYDDADQEVRYYPGWNSSTNLPTGPITVVRDDRAGGYTETLTMSATPSVSSGRPTGAESIGSLQSLTRDYRNDAGQVTYTDNYFNLSGVTYSTAANLGTLNTNYYRTETGYGMQEGRVNKEVSAAGTITRTEYDGLGRVTSIWVGTDDTPTTGYWSTTNLTGTNMVEVAAFEYDGGGVGDGNVTKVTQFPGGGAAARVTEMFYDWRDRAVAVKNGIETTESTSVNRPITYMDYDNLSEVTKTRTYDGDAVTITSTGGVPNAPSSSLLRAESTTSYDELGRAYRTDVHSVDPSSGSVGTYALHTDMWFDARGNAIKTAEPGGLVQKTAYDGVGRITATYETDGGGDSGYGDADDVTGDIVLSQDEATYDADGNVTLTIHRDRFHDATATGALGSPSSTSGTAKARVSYTGMFYDLADRPVASVDVGTNGGVAWTLPSSVPSRSDSVLVTSTTYDAAGNVYETTDPRGLVTRTLYDALGRTAKTIENYVDGVVSDTDDKTTEYTYGPAGMTSLTADLTGGGGQTTAWVYGVTTGSGSAINSNDIVGRTEWPDPTTGAASSGQADTVTVNGLGQPVTTTDRNGSTHTLTYDVLGRVVSDAVTTLGSGVDGAVRRIETAYDGQGNPYLATSYDSASGGSVVNQVERQYNGLGQMTRELQAHSGTVNTSTTPSVQYAYSEMAGGANNSRLTSVTNPSGYVLTYNYSSGINDGISRLSSLSDTSGTLETYSYLGLGTVVLRGHPQTGVDLTMLGTGPGSGGDQYVGLDSFGRVVDQNWKGSSASTDEFTYTYDRDGNRLTKGNAVNSTFNESYSYDGLNQIAGFTRGSHTQSWDYDAVGNMDSVTTNGTTQTRTANAQNEVTAVSGATTPAFDANGNMTTDETGRQFVYDAWNRMVAVKNSGGTTLKTYAYDGLNRRVTETAGGATTDLYYSAQWQVLEERVSGGTTARYVWSPVYVDAMVLRDRATTTPGTLDERVWVQQDANFNVTAITDGSGTVLERYVYDPYGVRTVLTPSFGSRSASSYDFKHGFQGLMQDGVTGLLEADHRWYSPTLMRWTSSDPIGFAAGDNNLYRFVGNEPTGELDSTGLAVGHHWVPASIFLDNVIRSVISDDAMNIAAGFVSGETEPGHLFGTYGGVTHKEYNDLVKEQLQKYIKANGIDATNKMTEAQMQEFAGRMRDGLQHDGSRPWRTSKFRGIKAFNDAIEAERLAFEASHPKAKPTTCDVKSNANRGKWYRSTAGRFAGFMLTSAVGNFISGSIGGMALASDDIPGKRNYFKEGVGALSRGDLSAADKAFVGNSESDLGGFAGQLNDAGYPKQALEFAQWWRSASADAKTASSGLPQK